MILISSTCRFDYKMKQAHGGQPQACSFKIRLGDDGLGARPPGVHDEQKVIDADGAVAVDVR